MKKTAILIACVLGLAATQSFAADAKDYQVTGPVLEVNPTYIVVHSQKEDNNWQIATDAATKGDKPKVGDKVTVRYSMTASSIEVKADKAEKKAERLEKKVEKAEKKSDKK